MQNKHRVLILGGGSGGISIAARLAKDLGRGQIAMIEPAEHHFYQPLWTLVGAGLVKKEKTKRLMSDLIPKGVAWLKEKVAQVDPVTKVVHCESGLKAGFDFLVIATGLKLDFHKIKGVEGNLGKNGLCSIYQYEDAEQTAHMIQTFKGGTSIFTMPPVPIKCAGAPQKIMYLADEVFRKNSVRDQSDILFTVAGKVIFGVPAFAKPLTEVASRKGIGVRFGHTLTEVQAEEKIAVFETAIEGAGEVMTQKIKLKYDLLHVVPPMSAHSFIQKSGLAVGSGPQESWLKVNQHTLQHSVFPFIFGIGDVTGVPNSKTGAAVRKQAPVVAQNLLSTIAGKDLKAKYDGYSSCPLITGFGKVILAEFGYDGVLMPSFPMDMTKERRSMWILKKDLLPHLYWQGMMKGKM